MDFQDRSNQLQSLPVEIGNFTNLIQLHLRNNRLTVLPKEICSLTNLIQLSLRGNQLTSPPPEIVQQGVQAILTYLREQL
ncbi:MAG TPA: leucine-rich repeat domain-containing protein [Waterburya sp.]|jgi:Leucine-rich repeat (LRR) protein